MPTENTGLITQTEACRQFGLDAKTLRRRIADGTIPVYRDTFDRRIRLVRTADLERLKKPHRVPTTGGAVTSP
jgi:excisionase family DNA binding protein